jgi:hypothetical protein
MGYPIIKGKLSIDLDYSVSENFLIGENKVHIDQLTLGDATDSPDAPSLPVPLALALLKDRDGQIDIDLPVRGDLNNPEFSYEQLVLQTLVNLITKAATSPLSLIGGLLGGSGDDLVVVQFPVGQAVLAEGQIGKLSTLASALSQRPGLRLEITGGAGPAKDGLSIAEVKLEDQLKEIWQQESVAPGQTKSVSSAEVNLSSTDQDRLVKKLFLEKFGQDLGKERSSVGERSSGGSDTSADSPSDEEVSGSRSSPSKKHILSLEDMRQWLLETIQITEDELRQLAQERARSIRDHLVNQEKISEGRIFLVEANLAPKSDGEIIITNLTLIAH